MGHGFPSTLESQLSRGPFGSSPRRLCAHRHHVLTSTFACKNTNATTKIHRNAYVKRVCKRSVPSCKHEGTKEAPNTVKRVEKRSLGCESGVQPAWAPPSGSSAPRLQLTETIPRRGARWSLFPINPAASTQKIGHAWLFQDGKRQRCSKVRLRLNFSE